MTIIITNNKQGGSRWRFQCDSYEEKAKVMESIRNYMDIGVKFTSTGSHLSNAWYYTWIDCYGPATLYGKQAYIRNENAWNDSSEEMVQFLIEHFGAIDKRGK